MIGSLLVVGWVAYNFLKKSALADFFPFPCCLLFGCSCGAVKGAKGAKGNPLQHPPSASEGTAKATIDKKGGREKWKANFSACLQNEAECRACLIAFISRFKLLQLMSQLPRGSRQRTRRRTRRIIQNILCFALDGALRRGRQGVVRLRIAQNNMFCLVRQN